MRFFSIGEIVNFPAWGNCCWGSCSWESWQLGKLSIGEFVIGEVAFGETTPHGGFKYFTRELFSISKSASNYSPTVLWQVSDRSLINVQY